MSDQFGHPLTRSRIFGNGFGDFVRADVQLNFYDLRFTQGGDRGVSPLEFPMFGPFQFLQAVVFFMGMP